MTTIKFEGISGCGKTTMLNLVRRTLETKGYLVTKKKEHQLEVEGGDNK